ncbi:exopolysaccharide Pel transporter PelG [Azotosporobacter soli]|uniref:exopolysaccharide Pel transporter PelG n=1 Tax=Azotosporobacter soli TaxID=3055040 RepID=UPI0031FE88C1
MAGIGFELKKLFNKTSTVGYLMASFYTAIVTLGPFMLATLMILAIQQLMTLMDASYYSRQLYLGSIVYPFIFSQIVSSGFSMLITRYVADRLFNEQYEEIIPSLFGILALALALGAVPALLFLWNSPLPLLLKVLTYLLYMELIIVWIQGVYLSALKDYLKIIFSYAAGTATAVFLAFAALYLLPDQDSMLLGILFAVCSGVFVILALLLFYILQFFPLRGGHYFAFLHYFDDHTRLFVTNFCYTLGIYTANFFLWRSDAAQIVAGTYRFSPTYDVATFYAFLSIMPTMAAFVVSAELVFYDKYRVYFSAITGKGNYQEIETARQDMLQTMWSEIRNLFEFQLVFSLLFLALGDFLLPGIGITHESIDIYNILILGSFAIGMAQIIQIILLYFDARREALLISLLFFTSNFALNLIGLHLPTNLQGFPFFLSSMLTVSVSIYLLHSYAKRLDYFVFSSQPMFTQTLPGLLQRVCRALGANLSGNSNR